LVRSKKVSLLKWLRLEQNIRLSIKLSCLFIDLKIIETEKIIINLIKQCVKIKYRVSDYPMLKFNFV